MTGKKCSIEHFLGQFEIITSIQSNANHPLAESMGHIKFEGM